MATTINAYSVSLGLDARDYIQNSALSRSETNQLARSIEKARTPAENYERSLTQLKKAYESGAISNRVYNRLVDDTKKKFHASTTAAKGFTSSLMGVSAGFLSFAAITGVIRKAVLLNSEMVSTSAQFEVFTGSVQASNKMLAEMRDLASEFYTWEVIANKYDMLIKSFFHKYQKTEVESILSKLPLNSLKKMNLAHLKNTVKFYHNPLKP